MCGIAAFFGTKQAKRHAVTSMHTMQGRGKDGWEVWSNATSAIGHKLHALVGHERQPFCGKGMFAANCEIYNWKTLKPCAKNDAHALFLLLEETSDDDIPSILEHVDGDYAFVYYRANRVYVARDLVGVKPLFYATTPSFGIASERHVLESLGYLHVKELHPRHLLVHTNNHVRHVLKSAFAVHSPPQEPILALTQALVSAVAKRIPCVPFGILFSGGIDSTLITIIAQQLGYRPNLYCVHVKDAPDSKDVVQAESIAAYLDLPLHIISITQQEIEETLPRMCTTIASSEVTKVGTALITYFAAQRATRQGIKVLLSGGGSDDLLGGYARQNDTYCLTQDCVSNMRKVFERDTLREDTASMIHSVETRFPYYDRDVIHTCLSLTPEQKHPHQIRKGILKAVAQHIGYKGPLYIKKTAAQYGSRTDYALQRLAKHHGFGNRKAAYLHALYSTYNGRIAALVSGGKDSLLALHIMHQKHYEIACIVCMKSKNEDSYMFHTPTIDLVELQAQALGIPLITVETRGEKENELEDLERGLREAQRTFHIEGVCTGAIASTYQRDRIDALGESLGLKVYAPLWHKNQELVLRELFQRNFSVIITRVAAEGLDRTWIGIPLTTHHVKQLKSLHDRLGLHIAGEGGEFETLVLDMPLFTQRISIHDSSLATHDSVSTLHVKKATLVPK